MELVLLIACVVAAWTISTAVDSLPNLGHVLVPSHWVLWGAALMLITWLMRD